MLPNSNTTEREIVDKTMWLLLAVAINAFEFFIPRIPFFPWLKPGFANIVTIIWIIEYGALDAILYSLLRTWIVGFFFGFSFFTMALSACGGLCATIAMSGLWVMLGKRKIMGTVGIGICGALFHNIGQLAAVYGLMSANTRLFYQLPLMLFASVFLGGIVGFCAPLFHAALLSYEKAGNQTLRGAVPSQLETSRIQRRTSARDIFFSILLLCISFSLVFVSSLPALCIAAGGSIIAVQIQKRGSISTLIKPIRSFWVLFLFIALINIPFAYGTRIEAFPLVTHEALQSTGYQWLRLFTWLELSYLLSHFNFHGVMFSALRRLFPNHRSTLYAGVLSLEYFPAIADDSRALVRRASARFFASPLVNIAKLWQYRKNIPMRLAGALHHIVAGRLSDL